MESETGLSLLGRLTDRPPLDRLFGPDGCRPPPAGQITPVVLTNGGGTLDSSGPVFASFCSELICNVVLPTDHKGVQLGGCGASLVLVNCNHHVAVMDVAEELQARVRKIAEDHYRSLPVNRRKTERLTSTDQWQVVKQSLERLLVLEAATGPDSLETSLIALRGILATNSNISCILIDSINTFYHQVHAETGLYHSAYLRRLRAHLTAACRDTSPALRILYTQLQFFNTEDRSAAADQATERILLTAGDSAGSYRVRCGQLEFEWSLK